MQLEQTDLFTLKNITPLSGAKGSIVRILFRGFDGIDGKRFFLTLRTLAEKIDTQKLIEELLAIGAHPADDTHTHGQVLSKLSRKLRSLYPESLLSATYEPSDGHEDSEVLIDEGVIPEYYHSTSYAGYCEGIGSDSIESKSYAELAPLPDVKIIAGQLYDLPLKSLNQYLIATCGLAGTTPLKLTKGGGIASLARHHGVLSSIKHFYPHPENPFRILAETINVISGPSGVLCLTSGLGNCHQELSSKIILDHEMNAEMHKHSIMTVTRIIEHILESNESLLEGLELVVDWLFELAFRDKLTHDQALEYFSLTYCSLGAFKKAHLSLHHIFAGLDMALDADNIFHADTHDIHSIKTAKEYVKNLSTRASDALQKLEGAKSNYDRHREHSANANMLKLTIAIGATVGPMLMDFYFGKQNQTAMLIGALISIAIMVPTGISWVQHRYGRKWRIIASAK